MIFTSPEVRSNLELLCDDLGSRFVGTKEEEQAAQFLQEKLRQYAPCENRSTHETVDKIRLIDIREAAFLAARLIWRIANEDHWPFSITPPDELSRKQQEYDRLAVCQIEAAVEKLREGFSS